MPCLPHRGDSLGLNASLFLSTPLSRSGGPGAQHHCHPVSGLETAMGTWPQSPTLTSSPSLNTGPQALREGRHGGHDPQSLGRNKVWGHGCDNGQPSQVAGVGGVTGWPPKRCFVSVSFWPVRPHVVSHPGVKVHSPPNSNPAGDKERVEWVTKS